MFYLQSIFFDLIVPSKQALCLWVRWRHLPPHPGCCESRGERWFHCDGTWWQENQGNRRRHTKPSIQIFMVSSCMAPSVKIFTVISHKAVSDLWTMSALDYWACLYNCLFCRIRTLNVNTKTPTTVFADSHSSSMKQSWRHYYLPLLSAEVLRLTRVKWLSAELRRVIIIIIVITADFSLELTCLLGFPPSTLYKQFF